MRRLTRSAVVVAVLALLLTVTAGTASALWSVVGAGAGAATVTGTAPLTVSLTPATPLFPGQPAQPADLVLRNPNRFPVTVTRLTPGAVVVTGGTACTAVTSAVSFSELSGSWTVPAGGVLGPVAVPAAVRMGAASADGCQGASFSAPLTVTATS